ncbi:Ig-like domain-containing protein [Hymenobacter weizhouensis]|uniref:Ig-like domain-containing protein n=1 Tax=Hymenobacter sp. YIM 151500-1 TaxID=2987689 RepID=UPI0022269D7B|nr:Ig-like domain-containing protein [Hymenobacter sp. YIM 151500-1]UYZ63628.1 Ig-like domain-containing protein [Hymenobacter sp. YIM 151500-1]
MLWLRHSLKQLATARATYTLSTICVAVGTLLAWPAAAQTTGYKAREKKLIEFGWDIPTADYVKNNIGTMEKQSFFDGLCFNVSEDLSYYRAFENRALTPADMQLGTLSQINWSRFTHNFITLLVMSKNNAPAWYDDALWKQIVANMRLFSQAAKAAKCKGFMLDPEFYYYKETHSPWVYNTTLYPGKTFAEVEAKVWQRGREFVGALQAELPQADLLFTISVSLSWAQCEGDVSRLAGTQYALLPAFTAGILEAAGTGVTLIDGHEGGYYTDETRKYTGAYDYVRNQSAGVMPADVQAKYRANFRMGEALYVEQVFDSARPADYKKSWFEHNAYNALLVTDQYVWCYSERGDGGDWAPNSMNWWTIPPRYLPAGLTDALTSARRKLSAGQALGFDMVKTTGYWDETVAATFETTPQISIVSPANDAQLPANQPLTVTTSLAACAAVSKVEFYVNSRLAATTTAAPRSPSLTNLAPGTYTIFARVFTPEGKHVTSNPVTIDVVDASAGVTYYRLKNRWLGTYLFDDGDKASYAATASGDAYLWAVEQPGRYTQLRNKATGDYLHVEHGQDYVECTPVSAANAGWWSKDWTVEGYSGYTMLKNRWQAAQYVHVEQRKGYAQHTPISKGTWSSQWQLEAAPSASTAAAPAQAEAAAASLAQHLVAGHLLPQDSPRRPAPAIHA